MTGALRGAERFSLNPPAIILQQSDRRRSSTVITMRRETTERTARSPRTPGRVAAVAAGAFLALVGVPALVLAEYRLGVLSTVGLGGQLPFAALVMVPGFLLGGLSLVAMLGS